jgi:Flp pilus assembly protein CpaB
MKRALYLGGATILALIAALLTLRAQHTDPVVVAAHPIHAGVVVTGDDVQVVRMHDDGIPAGAATSPDQVVGRYVSWPLSPGEPVLASSLTSARSGGSAAAGLDIPSGYSAIAVPVQPAAAVGGMLAPGDHVDVFASPAHPADAAGADSSPARLLGSDVLVIQVRSDQGQSLDGSGSSSSTTVHGLNFSSGKLGSVVLAVPAADVPTYAAAVNGDVIYLSLSVS